MTKLIGLLFALCFFSPPALGVVDITMLNNAFYPLEIVITRGETLRWINNSLVPHTVTANPSLAADASHVTLPPGAAPFHSGVLNVAANFSHRFTTPGVYQYVCLFYESAGMIGRVIVQ